MELRMYLEILRRRRLLILAVTVIVAAVAGLTSSLKTPVYTATAKVLLRPGDPAEEFNPAKATRLAVDPNRYLAGQIDIIESENVAEAAGRELNEPQAKNLLDHLSAHQAGTTDIVAISYTDPDAVRASQVANAFAHAYIEDRRVTSVAGLERASREVDAKLIEVERRLADLDTQIVKQTTTTTTATTTTTTTATTTTTKPPATTTSAPATTTTTISVAPAAPASRFPTTSTTVPSATTTGAKAAGGTGPLAFVLISARDGAPLLGQVTAPDNNPEALKAARDAAAVQYESLYSRQQELLITTSLKRGEAELIAAAGVPGAPSSPKPQRDLALGTVVGMMLGLGFAFLREQLDDRLHSREDVEEASGLPVLAELPLDSEAARNPAQVSAHERPSGGLAESTRGLRTSLTFVGVDEPVRCLLVTSPGQGDGKSFVAANLAAAYAQAGFSTVLVSADLRRPRLESLFPGVAPGPGLSEVIAGLTDAPSTNGHGEAAAGDAALTQALRRTQVDGLRFLPAGKLPPNPAELLGSRRALSVLEALSRLADVVIIDSPPLLAVTDAAVLAPHVDGVVLVAAPGRTHRGALARTVGMLSGKGVRLLGVVLNQVEGKGQPYSYSHYYGAYSAAGAAPPGRRVRLPWRRSAAAEAEPATAAGSEVEVGAE